MEAARYSFQHIFTCFLLLLPVAIRAEDQRPTVPAKNVLEEFDVGKNGDFIIVPITIGQKKYSFVLDTGSNTSMFDQSIRGILGGKIGDVAGETPTGEVTVAIHKSPKASLGHLDFEEEAPVALLDLSSIAPHTGYDVRGLLGMDFLVRHVVRINFDQGKLYFLRSPGDDSGVAIPLIIEEDLKPMVEVTIPAWGKERFRLDTGASGPSGVITKDIFVKLVRNKRLKVIAGGGSLDLAGEHESASGRLDQMRLGQFKHEDMIFGMASANLLGLEYLSRYVVTFDFPNRKMYLKKGERFSAYDELDLSGIDIVRKDGKTVVEEVAGSSPAAEAGIQPKDRIVKIGGQSPGPTGNPPPPALIVRNCPKKSGSQS
jgi:hypothetical protein